MVNLKRLALNDDIEIIKEQLAEFSSYDFAADIRTRMKRLGLTQTGLAGRLFITHAAVGKWLAGSKPHGKERMKELGLALQMDENELNDFLYANCYPKLYAKNPLDTACRFVIRNMPRAEDSVRIYRELIDIQKLYSYKPSPDSHEQNTDALSLDFANVMSPAELAAWTAANSRYFGAAAKTLLPNAELARFVTLYLGGRNINDLFVSEDLPVALRNLLYPLTSDKEITYRGLRMKLIVFGLYKNMTEDEIDLMLELAKQRGLSDPKSRLDACLLAALPCAHMRNAYYEFNTSSTVLKQLNPNANGLYKFFKQKLDAAQKRCEYQDNAKKSEAEVVFETLYTDYSGGGVLEYIKDLIGLLIEDGLLTANEASEILEVI